MNLKRRKDHPEHSFHMNMDYTEDKEERTTEAADSHKQESTGSSKPLRSSLDLITPKLYYNCWSSKTPSLLNDHSVVSNLPEIYFREIGRPQVPIQCSFCPTVTKFFTTRGEEPKQWTIWVEEVAPNSTQPSLPLPGPSPLPTTILPSTTEPASNQCPLPDPHSDRMTNLGPDLIFPSPSQSEPQFTPKSPTEPTPQPNIHPTIQPESQPFLDSSELISFNTSIFFSDPMLFEANIQAQSTCYLQNGSLLHICLVISPFCSDVYCHMF